MEVIKRYPQIDDMISALTRTANNLDTLLEIMTTTSIKKDDEIQNLKLENDRLWKRDELMSSLINDATCHTNCSACRFHIENKQCKLNVCSRYCVLMNELYTIFEKLEDL